MSNGLFILLFAIGLFIAYILYVKYNNDEVKDEVKREGMSTIDNTDDTGDYQPFDSNDQSPTVALNTNVPKIPQDSNALLEQSTQSETLIGEDLKPGDAGLWSDATPTIEQDVTGQNYLVAGQHIGEITTQGNKIVSRDIRSMPVIPRIDVSPWLKSDYEAPVYLKGVEITDNTTIEANDAEYMIDTA